MRAVADVGGTGGGVGAQGEERNLVVGAAFIAACAGVASFGIWHIEVAFVCLEKALSSKRSRHEF